MWKDTFGKMPSVSETEGQRKDTRSNVLPIKKGKAETSCKIAALKSPSLDIREFKESDKKGP